MGFRGRQRGTLLTGQGDPSRQRRDMSIEIRMPKPPHSSGVLCKDASVGQKCASLRGCPDPKLVEKRKNAEKRNVQLT